jgi:hypothetical protein
MLRTLFVGTVAACAVMAATAQIAPAAIITGFNLPSGPIVPVSTPAPNNNNTVVASPNVVDLPVAPGTALIFNDINPISIAFSSQLSGGATEYFTRETIINNSGVDWGAFMLQLPLVVTPVNGIGPAGFDSPTLDPPPTASAFGTLNTVANSLIWSGGVVPNGGTLRLTFSIDTPDPQPLLLNFSLSQIPSAVPEPAALCMFAVGGLVLILLVRMR